MAPFASTNRQSKLRIWFAQRFTAYHRFGTPDNFLTSSPMLCQNSALASSPCRAQLRDRVAISVAASSPYCLSMSRAISRTSSSSIE